MSLTTLKIASGLTAVFLGGGGVGYLLAEKAPATEPVPAPAWSANVLDRLTDDLGLTPEQQAAFAPALEEAGQKISDQRERTLFQIHFEVLAVHDRLLEIPGELDLAQTARLTRSREILQKTISKRFAKFLKDGGEIPAVSNP